MFDKIYHFRLGQEKVEVNCVSIEQYRAKMDKLDSVDGTWVQLRRAHHLLLHVPGVRVLPRQVLLPPAHWLLSGAHGVLPTQSSAGPGSGSARTAGPRTAGAEPNTALKPDLYL